ncbi:MAG: hypothetical protein A2Y24_06980 [Clostridiales bacterium GWE2_32_10]|nr:MAG: hypothetical protein A2Y24_06980 [Clostridiales bacterium GWE2_32_10]HBY19470.1 hypothetical protein [Clostridiales bacterium]
MIALTILLIIISIFEIKNMLENNQKKEIVIFVCITIIIWIIGRVYISDPFRPSIVNMIMSAFGIQF